MSAVLHFDEQRTDPGELASLVLAVLVHVLLALILIFGVRWQNRPPEAVTVELWEAPRPAPQPPVVVEQPKPAPRVEPTPPPPEPKPAPRIEKPDIVVKAPPPKPKPEVKKPEPPKAVAKPKPEPPKAKPEPAKPRPPSDAAAQRRLREELVREQTALATGRERDQIRDMLAREASAASAKSLAGWIEKIRAKIRGNILMPQEMKGNPEAIFDVVQLPTGEVLTVKLRKSSGNAAYDAAVERAILKSSPLPRPDRPDQFRRDLELKFRPHDQI